MAATGSSLAEQRFVNPSQRSRLSNAIDYRRSGISQQLRPISHIPATDEKMRRQLPKAPPTGSTSVRSRASSKGAHPRDEIGSFRDGRLVQGSNRRLVTEAPTSPDRRLAREHVPTSVPSSGTAERGIVDDIGRVVDLKSPVATKVIEPKIEVETRHAYTGRMCATSRYIESQRPDSLFSDPLAKKLAGNRALKDPMGAWILVPRTRYGDDLVYSAYNRKHEKGFPCRQLVLLGAGMDARAYRLENVPELSVFEVDQQTTFDVKEPLLEGERLLTKSRVVVGTDFSDAKSSGGYDRVPQWSHDLESAGFNKKLPTVWLLEGLMMYLNIEDQEFLIHTVGKLSCPGSVVFHDAISKTYESFGISVAGARFLGGSDDYIGLWAELGGFKSQRSALRTIDDVRVDRRNRSLQYEPANSEAVKRMCKGQSVCLFVEVHK